MKKLIALIALAGIIATGCAHNRGNEGGTSDSNYSTSDTSTGKMQNDNSSTTTSTNSNSGTPQQP